MPCKGPELVRQAEVLLVGSLHLFSEHDIGGTWCLSVLSFLGRYVITPFLFDEYPYASWLFKLFAFDSFRENIYDEGLRNLPVECDHEGGPIPRCLQ